MLLGNQGTQQLERTTYGTWDLTEIDMSIAPTTELEKTSLEAHVDLCALRYGQLEQRMANIETKVGTLQDTIEKSHMNMVKVLIGTAGTVVAGVLSTLVIILTKVH